MSKNILTETQKYFLELLGENKSIADNFYLTDGTALAAFYLRHRYSEDLDFFSEKEPDILQTNVFLKSIRQKLGIAKIDFQQSFNRNLFFLHTKGDVLKTEFTYFPFPRIEHGTREFGIRIDSLVDIATNKLFSIYQRTHARDYVDLYLISRESKFSLQELIKKAKEKFDWHIDPLQLGTQFVKAQGAEDYPRMIMKIVPEEWRSFFIAEAKKLKRETLE